MARHNDLGILGEQLAVEYLIKKGYVILEKNFRFEKHEIDIIAKKKNSLIFIEVKARQTKTQALESVTYKMRERIQRAAMHYCARNNISDTAMRFDLISVIPPLKIHHLDNAWQPQA